MQISIAVLGCGNRGKAYTSIIATQPENFIVTAIADTDPIQLELMHNMYSIPYAKDFTDIEAFMSEKRADTLIIATPDKTHVPLAIRAMELGYDVLLEKPVSDIREETEMLLQAQKKYNKKVMVCHVLRYAPAYRKCDELLASGKIGKLYAIDASERVVYWHWAQAYVRGIAGTLENAFPTILAKCCHDLDLVQHYAGSKCKSVSSIGGLDFFTLENAPKDSTERCVDCPHMDTCPYSAKRIYVDMWHEAGEPAYGFPFYRAANANPITEEALYEGIRTNPFGRCVFRCGATNADHQYVQMLFENGVKASMKMIYAAQEGRRIVFYGTTGEITLDEREDTVTLLPYGGEKEQYIISAMHTGIGDHGGGDKGLVDDLYGMLTDTKCTVTSLEESMESHLIGIAAEESRKADGKLVNVHK